MLKRYSFVLLALVMCLGVFSGCTAEGGPTNIKPPKAEAVEITDYLNDDAGAYYTNYGLETAKKLLAEDIENGTLADDEAIFAAYVNLCGNGSKELPKALVEVYTETLGGADKAKALIKEEMVVFLGFKSVDSLKALSFNDAVRAEAVKELNAALGGDYSFEKGLDASEYYAIDSYIKQQIIVSYLKGDVEENKYYKLCTPAEASAEESK